MHLTRVAFVLATASTYLAPTIALAIGQSQTSELESRDKEFFDFEGECIAACSGSCAMDFWGRSWQCKNNFGLIDPNNGTPKKSRLMPRDDISQPSASDADASPSNNRAVPYPNQEKCAQSCTGVCSGTSLDGSTWWCDPHIHLDLSKYPTATVSNQIGDNPPKSRLRSRAGSLGMTFNQEQDCLNDCAGICTADTWDGPFVCTADPNGVRDPSYIDPQNGAP